jgi:hypothetical protein
MDSPVTATDPRDNQPYARRGSLPQVRVTADLMTLIPQLLAVFALLSGLAPLAHAAPSGAQLSYYGGAIVEHPTYVNVYWGAYWTSGTGLTERTALNGFVQNFATSAEFDSVLAQYTGPGGIFPHVGAYVGEKLISGEPGAGTKKISDNQLQTALDSFVRAGLVPAPSPDLIYNVLLPPGVTVTLGTDSSGSQFCNYHYTAATTLGTGGRFRYVVAPYPDTAGCNFEPVIVDRLTVILSHSIAEAVTDPDVGLATSLTDNILGWYDANNGEIGDICADEPSATVLGYRVQTLWSNADNKCLAVRPAAGSTDTTPPVITPAITGTLGNNNWYTSSVLVSWTVSDPESPIASTTGCGPTSIVADTSGTVLSCSATSDGGTAAQSVTIQRDTTPPTVTYSGNASSYALNQTVAITCAATDALSGVAATSCQSISGPAYSFNIGLNSFSATATDNAGNTAAATTTFTVAESNGELAQLTNQFVDTSPVYLTLSTRQRIVVDGAVSLMDRILAAIQPGMNPIQKRLLVSTYKTLVAGLGQTGFLTTVQVGVLDRLVDSL